MMEITNNNKKATEKLSDVYRAETHPRRTVTVKYLHSKQAVLAF